jgi:hypothetical protein
LLSDLLKKTKGFPTILAFSRISHNCFCTGKVMDQVYGSPDHDWLSVDGGFAAMGRRGRFGAWEVVVIAQREREVIVGVLTNSATWRQSCGDGHMMTLNRGGVGAVDNVGAPIVSFIGL